MPRFVIEREMPGVGKLSGAELRDAAGTSNKILRELAPDIQWEHSYVTADKIYCVYLADSEDVIQEHARCTGFPATVVSKVDAVIDPTTEEV
ncbi:MAG TPA: DUF4242 domain-containing protein [Acidimicrobiia bacterium]|nr:DUF4242 domain-containing protein [Acidimicrobiia bacterium]